MVLGQLFSPPHPHSWQEQNQRLSVGVLEGHLTKALAVYRWGY